MIHRRSVPYLGSAVLLESTYFHDIQSLLLRGYAADELQALLGEKSLNFPASWVTVGKPQQLTALTHQRGQGRLILPLTGTTFVLSLRPRSHTPDPVVFRLQAGQGQAVWVPSGNAQGFYFVTAALLLTAATEFRSPNKSALDPTDKTYSIDIPALTGVKDIRVSPICEV